LRHEIYLRGPSFSLRPVRRSDAALIVRLRRDPDRARYLHPIEASIPAQEAYVAENLLREGDYYFVIERAATSEAEGLIAIYDVDPVARTAEWGRWILQPGSLAAVESALLIYRVAFDVLGLEEVVCRTFADNRPVVSFHDSCGLQKRAVLPSYFRLTEREADAVEHVLTRPLWPAVQDKLVARAERIGRRLERGETSE
jgi:RimJ/RimL family protein N-acetyltransferase